MSLSISSYELCFRSMQTLSEDDQQHVKMMISAISSHEKVQFERLLKLFQGDINALTSMNPNETLLWHALNQNNLHAAALLVERGASLRQQLPPSLDERLQNDFKTEFFKDKTIFGTEGEEYFKKIQKTDYENSLAYAIAAHYALQNPDALDLLLKDPEAITFNVLKVFIREGNCSAFQKVFPHYKQSILTTDNRGRDLLFYSLLKLDDSPDRLEIVKMILALNPDPKNLTTYGRTTFEFARSYALKYPIKSAQAEFILSKIFADPDQYQEIWGLQRLLINSGGTSLTYHKTEIDSGHYPIIAKHFHESLHEFQKANEYINDWIFFGVTRETSLEQCLELVNQKKILKFSNSWTGGGESGHQINAVISSKYLFTCNRGDGSNDETSGICIYEFLDSASVKELTQFFLDRKAFFENSIASKKFFVSGIAEHKGLKKVEMIKCSPQKVGNCVWLSEKMGIYACFIASLVERGYSLEKAIELGKAVFKQWTEFDRLKLLKGNLDHVYHLRPCSTNEQEGILFVDTIAKIMERLPWRHKSQSYDMIFEKLNDPKIKAALGNKYEPLFIEVLFARMNLALVRDDTPHALSTLKYVKDVNVKDKKGRTLLYLVCTARNVNVANELLDRGANPNVEFFNPLENLLAVPNQSAAYESLIKRLVEGIDLSGKLYLCEYAVQVGNLCALKEMLKKGVDIVNVDYKGDMTPLHRLAFTKSEEVIHLVISLFKNLNPKLSNDGLTPLHMAVQKDNFIVVQKLLESGADPNVMDTGKKTPLALAFREPIRSLLIQHGAK